MTIEAADRLAAELSSVVGEWAELSPETAGEWAVDGLAPRFRCAPATADELAAVLALADRAGAAVVPRGGGTRLGLGFPPRRADLVVDLRKLTRVDEYEPADLTITVEAGLTLAALAEVLRAEGQFLPLEAPLPDRATLGGTLATNTSGPLRLLYGTARDFVIGTHVVNADGTKSKAGGRVVKNVAGYDLNKLYIGSLGTVGVISMVSFKLQPLPEREATVWVRFRGLESARAAVAALLRSPLSPMALDLLDERAAAACGVEAVGNVWLLAARVGGFEASVERQVRDLVALAAQHGGEPQRAEPAAHERFWAAVRDWAQAPAGGALVRIATPIAQIGAALEQAGGLARASELAVERLARAGSGVGYLRVAGPAAGDERWVERFAAWVAAARALAVGLGGSLVVEDGPPAAKATVDVWGDVGGAFAIMRALKAELDPKGTLNPGRYVGRL